MARKGIVRWDAWNPIEPAPWNLRNKARSWPFRSWKPPSVNQRADAGDFKSLSTGSRFGEDGSSEDSSEEDEEDVCVKCTSQPNTKNKRESVMVKLYPYEGEDETDCPCGGCRSWGKRKEQQESVISETTAALLRNGIDIYAWGKNGHKSVWDLVWEQQNGHIELKADPETGKYSRFCRHLKIKLLADTNLKGPCVLMEKYQKNPNKFITKTQIGLDGNNWREKCVEVFQKEFHICRKSIVQHFVVLKHAVKEERKGAFHFPGLSCVYTIDEVCIKILNIKEADFMGLPAGLEFETHKFSKQRGHDQCQLWEWTEHERLGTNLRTSIVGATMNHKMYSLIQLVDENEHRAPRKSMHHGSPNARKSVFHGIAKPSHGIHADHGVHVKTGHRKTVVSLGKAIDHTEHGADFTATANSRKSVFASARKTLLHALPGKGPPSFPANVGKASMQMSSPINKYKNPKAETKKTLFCESLTDSIEDTSPVYEAHDEGAFKLSPKKGALKGALKI